MRRPEPSHRVTRIRTSPGVRRRPLLPPRSPGFATSRKFKVVTSTTESVCMSSAGTPRNRHGQKRIGCSVRSIRRPSSRLRRVLRDPAPKVSVGCSNCTAAVRLTRRASERGRWRLRRTCGPASDWCEGVQAPHWSVRTKKWLIGLPSTRRSAWITSYCRAIPISKRRISSVRVCVRSSKSVDW